MRLWEMVLTLVLPLGTVIWGVSLYHQRGTWLLAGWNTMPKEKKAAYNEAVMCQLFGRCIVFCGVGFFLILYGSFQGRDTILCAGLALVGAMVVLTMLIPRFNPQKYRKK